jgi:hypothetical protein
LRCSSCRSTLRTQPSRSTAIRFRNAQGRRREKYRKKNHEVNYVQLADTGHVWGTKAEINETIWKFFAEHPLGKK